MFEYMTRLDGSTAWACYTEEPLYLEVNITGITDETEIQNKLSSALETVKDFDN
tara:strand:- start:40 stop:201 length:162 start_codon:yes stop_codon:yes gene_type:complete